MHEAAFAVSLLEQVLGQARMHCLARVTRVRVDLGVQRLVVPEALALAFSAASQDTVAQDAELQLREVALRARCRSCGGEYAAAIDDYQCPSCGQADAELLAGHEVVLMSLEGEEV